MFKKEAGTGSVLQSENSNDVGQYHTFISGPIIDSESNGASEEILDDKSDVVSVGSICDAEEMSKVLELVKNLPSDSFVVSMPKRNWVSLSRLMELLIYPRSNVNCEWYIQKTPADGNCLFSAFMMAANVRGMLPLSLRSVPSLRGALKRYLKQLSSAGLEDSAFRREWLASSIHEIDNKELRLFHSNGFDRCMQSGTEADIENLLKPLRFFVSNWAEMIGDSHWGGLPRVELAILATIAGAVIEVLQKVETVGGKVDGNGQGVTVFDTRGGGSLVSCRRVDLVYPFRSKLPCTHDGFVGPIGEGMVRGGWIGPYPVLRLFLHQRHYNPCTSRYGFPIAPLLETPCNKPWSVWFNDSDTLVEPYSVLNAEEAVYYTRALTMIEDWHEASRWAPGSAGHADPLVMHSKNTELCISKLSHLQIPNEMKSTDERYMLNDEVITCYMHLLEDRANKLAQLPMREKSHAPPRCRYMDSWFYKALSRGLTGPSSRKRNKDLSSLSIIVLPALVNKHWVLAVCYMKDFVIGVYDPLQRRREEVFKVVKQWIEVHIPPPGDVEWCFKEIRESRECLQQGGVDCGVFICKAAESLGLGIPIRVSQWDIPYVRKRMMVELFRQEAISIRWPRF